MTRRSPCPVSAAVAGMVAAARRRPARCARGGGGGRTRRLKRPPGGRRSARERRRAVACAGRGSASLRRRRPPRARRPAAAAAREPLRPPGRQIPSRAPREARAPQQFEGGMVLESGSASHPGRRCPPGARVGGWAPSWGRGGSGAARPWRGCCVCALARETRSNRARCRAGNGQVKRELGTANERIGGWTLMCRRLRACCSTGGRPALTAA
jgi:hypothetical protein